MYKVLKNCFHFKIILLLIHLFLNNSPTGMQKSISSFNDYAFDKFLIAEVSKSLF